MNDMKARHQQPEGALIESYMAGPPRLSTRQLAEAVGLSEGRVRQIVNGYRTQGGQTLEMVAPAKTLARIARRLGIPREKMVAAGREDAAGLLDPQPRNLALQLWDARRRAGYTSLNDFVKLLDARPGLGVSGETYAQLENGNFDGTSAAASAALPALEALFGWQPNVSEKLLAGGYVDPYTGIPVLRELSSSTGWSHDEPDDRIDDVLLEVNERLKALESRVQELERDRFGIREPLLPPREER